MCLIEKKKKFLICILILARAKYTLIGLTIYICTRYFKVCLMKSKFNNSVHIFEISFCKDQLPVKHGWTQVVMALLANTQDVLVCGSIGHNPASSL